MDARGLHHDGRHHVILGVDPAGTSWPKGYPEEIGAGGSGENPLWFSPPVTVFRLDTPEGAMDWAVLDAHADLAREQLRVVAATP